jgi:hypothetical protein
VPPDEGRRDRTVPILEALVASTVGLEFTTRGPPPSVGLIGTETVLAIETSVAWK